MQSAKPRPRRMFGRSAGRFQAGSPRRCQPIARSAWATHSSVPQLVTRGTSSGATSVMVTRSPRRSTMSSGSPTRTQLRRRSSIGSSPSARAMSSMCALEREQALRRAVAPHGSADGPVRVGDVAGVALGGAVVGGEPAQAGQREDREAVDAVGSGVADDVHVLGDEAAVVHDAAPEGDRLGVAGARGDELLLARKLQPHRAAGRQHEVADDVLDQHLLLGAERAADPGLEHADLLHRQPEQRRHHPAHVEGHLGRGAEHEALVAVQPARRDVRLDPAMLDRLDVERLLEDVVCGCERSLDVGHGLALDMGAAVVRGVEDAEAVGLVVDHGRSVGHRLAARRARPAGPRRSP